MKILSLWQPHASAMALGLKKVETRGWATSYRGPVAIHAAKKWDTEIKAIIGSIPQEFKKQLDEYWTCGYGYEFPLGAIVAVGDLVACWQSERFTPNGLISREAITPDGYNTRIVSVDMTDQERAFGNYDPGRFGWVFENIRPLRTPLPFKGGQGLRNLDAEMAKKVRALAE